jgi:hypothetical protein
VLVLEVIATLKEQKVQLCSGTPSNKDVVDMIKLDSVNSLDNLNEFLNGEVVTNDITADLIEMLEDELENLNRFKTE